MKTPTWQRWAARTVLVTFSTCVVACGGSSATPPTTTTVPSPTVPATAPPPPPPMPPAPPPTMPPAPPAPSPTIPAQPPEQLGKQDLQKLVAPIALYPDVVLGSLLPATTFPEQIHDAAAYVGTAARVDRVPEDRGWDGSIIGLMQFPDVLRWLDDNPAWTDEMGQAVTFQQADVLQAIQDYRKLAMDAGNLKSNQYQTVQYVENAPIRIEPAHPDVVYVPSYDAELALQPQPAVVYPGVNPWIMFGAGAAVGALGAFALYSIFDDDYHHGGGYHINHYNNYYYSRGRRPAAVGWTARERAWHARPGQINHPRRLEYRSAQANRMGGAPLHPPVNRPGEMRQDRQLQKQENRMDRQQQQRDLRQQRQQQRVQQRQQQQQQRQEHQQQRQEHQQQQRDLRQQHQQQQRDMREQHQQQKRDVRQQHQQQRIENRQQQQPQHQQHQENRQMHQEQHQQQHGGGGGGGGGGGHGGGGENKKKQHH